MEEVKFSLAAATSHSPSSVDAIALRRAVDGDFSLRRRDPSPPWQWVFVLAFTGVRGIVSLAAALAIPLATFSGQPFPDRDLILFLTFSVILVTLVGQGLLLPTVIHALGLGQAGRRERRNERAEEHAARQQAIKAVMKRLGLTYRRKVEYKGFKDIVWFDMDLQTWKPG